MDSDSWAGLIVGVCLVCTTFFSVTNYALRHISWNKLEETFADRGHPQRVQFYRERMNRLVSGTASLRMLVNLGVLIGLLYGLFPAYSGSYARPLAPLAKAFVYAGGLLVVFSIGIPLAWARHAGTTILARSYPLLRFFDWLTWPLTYGLHLFDPPIRRLARLARVARGEGEDRIEDRHEELLSAVGEGEISGTVDEEEREMIESVLEFRDTRVGEIMTPRTEIVGIPVHDGLRAAIETIIQAGHSRFPVFEDSIDNVIGMLYAKDLLKDLNLPEDDQVRQVRQRLRKPYFVPASKSLRDLLHEFQEQKIHMAVVLDEYGGTAGIVTIEDVLEELVGEITDEYESPQAAPLVRIDERTWEVDARYEVDELNEECELNIPEDDAYETVGGFAFSRLGYIPQAGETFDYDNLHFTILDAGRRKINRLRIEIVPEPQTDEQ
ncbi:MAG: HlyC/CorC family transporter [Sedimentisphaerales bacterium]|nr:HlyC/CorC family transporter [Sedimentisphaerales bacterium]